MQVYHYISGETKHFQGEKCPLATPSRKILNIYVIYELLNFIDDCTIDDCMVDDGCVTEESYNAGTFDSCFGEWNDQLNM